MEKFRKMVWIIVMSQVAILLFTLVAFDVDDMTLAKGKMSTFNRNWTLYYEDGKSEEIVKLPYQGKSKKGETIRIENTIPRKYWGQTMVFLSADKTVEVYIDGEPIYAFGVNDHRAFGHTPGSVVNFVDIPENLDAGQVKIIMNSAYEDYAANIKEIQIAKRDVAIVNLLRENMLNIACTIVILMAGIIFAILAVIQSVSRQSTDGMQYLSPYCFVASIYFFIETKALTILYGNQTLYSTLVFLCLMLLPFFQVLYYEGSMRIKFNKRFTTVLTLISINVFVQMILQMANVVDFMDMVVVSHVLIVITYAVGLKCYYDIGKKDGFKEVATEVTALVFLGTGCLGDIMRHMVFRTGDMGVYSRFGMMIFCLILVFRHIHRLALNYSANIEKSKKLLQREVEVVEKQNRQLTIAKEEAEEAKMEAQQANEAKRKFLANVSHEIRTPINAVLGMNHMILRESKDAQIQEYASDIKNAGENLLSLVNDILDFSKIESGKMEILPEKYELSKMIRDTYAMIELRVEKKKLDFTVTVDENLPSKLYGDDVRIRQIMINLLTNAVKYTHEGSIQLNIGGYVEDEIANLHIEVKDTGIGIKEEDIEKLYVAFERIEEKKNRSIEGTGLGMNITTLLLDLMGSKLEVTSVYGEGSTFSFWLKQKVLDAAPVGKVMEDKVVEEEYVYEVPYTAPEAKILVVDDNLINRKVLVGLLKDTLIQTEEAENGKECLEIASKQRFDLIFLDHMMPEMDGIETLHAMKAKEDFINKDTPVVVLTANTIQGAKEMYIREGFDDFLGKPVMPDELEAMVKKILPESLIVLH